MPGYRQATGDEHAAASGDAYEDTRRKRAERVGELALAQGRTIAVAESLTGGMIASALAQAQQASQWFRGSLVAYSTQVKHHLLEVPDGPVVSGDAATMWGQERAGVAVTKAARCLLPAYSMLGEVNRAALSETCHGACPASDPHAQNRTTVSADTRTADTATRSYSAIGHSTADAHALALRE
jgi:hypothetical protein